MARIVADSDLLNELAAGVNALADILAPNYGPNGRNTIFDQEHDIALIVNAGKKILADFSLIDHAKNLGASTLKDAALRANKLNGDGTIATVIMANAMIEEGRRLIASGVNPIQLRKGIKKAIPVAEQLIHKMAIPVDSLKVAENVATIAADSVEIGHLVAEAFKIVGSDGIITVTDSQELENRLEISEGIRYDYGYASSIFVNIPEKKQAVLENTYILLVNRELKDFSELEKLLNQLIRKRMPLLIIAEDIDERLVKILANNIHHKVLNVVVGLGPGHGDTRRRNMLALAAKTGAALIDEYNGLELKDCGLEICGFAESVCLGKDTTLIKGFPKENREIVGYLKNYVKNLLSKTDADYEIEKLKQTQAILNGCTVTVVAGGTTEYEMFENQFQIENAVQAVYSALNSGVTAGGGKSYLQAIPVIEQLISSGSEEEKMGGLCIKAALCAPAYHIAQNAGANGSYIVSSLLECTDKPFWGFDAKNQQFTDFREAGILDSVDVVCSSFKIAAEYAATILTANAGVIYHQMES
ncbi:MAG: chaperonin GroEL [Lachnospiraceae bacterium]|nr:chaperonin GroEL [Lachnospiraceae bacterium]